MKDHKYPEERKMDAMSRVVEKLRKRIDRELNSMGETPEERNTSRTIAAVLETVIMDITAERLIDATGGGEMEQGCEKAKALS